MSYFESFLLSVHKYHCQLATSYTSSSLTKPEQVASRMLHLVMQLHGCTTGVNMYRKSFMSRNVIHLGVDSDSVMACSL